MTDEEKKSNKPVKSFKSALIELAVWENQAKDKDGKEFISTSFTIHRSYKDGDDWKTTTSFRPSDMPRVSAVFIAFQNWHYFGKAQEKAE